MRMQPLTVLPLALALLLALPSASAQTFTTSHGQRTLPRADTLQGEAQLRQAIRIGEEVTAELLQDIAAVEGKAASLSNNAAGLPDQVKAANADYDRARAAFEQSDQRYRQDLASFQQRESALDADIQRQRAAAAAISPALPLDQYNQAIADVNAWATRLGTERAAVDAERSRLIAAHDQVEADRVKLEKDRRDTEERLKQSRDATTSEAGTAGQQTAELYKQLKTAADYLNDARSKLAQVSKLPLAPSPMLEQATAKLRARSAR